MACKQIFDWPCWCSYRLKIRCLLHSSPAFHRQSSGCQGIRMVTNASELALKVWQGSSPLSKPKGAIIDVIPLDIATPWDTLRAGHLQRFPPGRRVKVGPSQEGPVLAEDARRRVGGDQCCLYEEGARAAHWIHQPAPACEASLSTLGSQLVSPAWAAGKTGLGSPSFSPHVALFGFHGCVHLPSFLLVNSVAGSQASQRFYATRLIM